MPTPKNFLNSWLARAPLFSPECALLLLAVFSRLVPHAPNFTALGAVAVFSAYFFRSRREAIAVALAALLISDLVIGFYPYVAWVYGAFLLTMLVGRALAKASRLSWSLTIGANVVAALVFFFVTNFGVWATGTLYARTTAGLVECFVAAIPFFGNTLASQLIFGVALFGSHRFLETRRQPKAVRAVPAV